MRLRSQSGAERARETETKRRLQESIKTEIKTLRLNEQAWIVRSESGRKLYSKQGGPRDHIPLVFKLRDRGFGATKHKL